MKASISTLVLFLLLTSSTVTAFATCTPGTDWIAAWTDGYGETTYAMEAPCKVYIGIPFSISATVTDSTYPNGIVGFGWAIKDNGATIAGGGFNWITTVNGEWQKVLGITYSGTPIDHLFQFNFTDLGDGGGAHWWGSNVVGSTTVDPYPPAPNTAPVVDAGPGIFMPSENQASTVVAGTASDADGDALSYRWLEGSNEVQASRPIDASGTAPLDLEALPPLSIGDHTFTLEVTDGKATVTDSTVVSVENSAPVVSVSGGGTFNLGDAVRVNGTVADFDGDLVSYQWMEGDNVLVAGEVATVRGGAPVPLPEAVIADGLPLGTHTLSLKVTDGINQASSSLTVEVIDTTAPTLAPAPSTTMLWPPNGTMTEVTINTNARDNSGGPIFLNVLLTTNQPQLLGSDGKQIPDWTVEKIDQAAGVIYLQLRNSRSGKGGDKIYNVAITATDASGNASTASVSITAPHDKRRVDLQRGRSALANGKATAVAKGK